MRARPAALSNSGSTEGLSSADGAGAARSSQAGGESSASLPLPHQPPMQGQLQQQRSRARAVGRIGAPVRDRAAVD